MAGIDKIYGTVKQYKELRDWLYFCKKKKAKIILEKLWHDCNSGADEDDEIYPICSLSQRNDFWLLRNCPLAWVKSRIIKMYSRSPIVLKNKIYSRIEWQSREMDREEDQIYAKTREELTVMANILSKHAMEKFSENGTEYYVIKQ